MKDYIVQSQQQVNLREGKVLWGTWQVNYVRPMTCASEGWEFITIGVEIVSSLGDVYPTHTTSRLDLILWQD